MGAVAYVFGIKEEMFKSRGGRNNTAEKVTIFDQEIYRTEGSPKNNFTELALRFVLDLVNPISQSHRNSSTILRILQMRTDEDAMEMRCKNGSYSWASP